MNWLFIQQSMSVKINQLGKETCIIQLAQYERFLYSPYESCEKNMEPMDNNHFTLNPRLMLGLKMSLDIFFMLN